MLIFYFCFVTMLPLVVMITLRWWAHSRSANSRMDRLPPGTMGIPLLGQTLELLEHRPVTSFGKFMEKGCMKYGKVFKARLFGKSTIVSTDAELNKFILANEGRLFECSFLVNFADIVGKRSIFLLAGEAHKRMRSITVHFLHYKRLKENFFTDIDKNAQLVLEAWKEDEIISARDEVDKFVFHVLAKSVLSFSPEEARTLEIMKSYKTFIDGMKGIPLNIPGTAYHRAIQSRKKLIKIFKEEMAARKRQNDGVTYEDYLSIAAQEGNLAAEEIVDNLIALFFAGHQNPAAVLTYAIKFLAQNPESLKELRAEHARIRSLKQGGEKELDWDDYEHRMIFTKYVIDESLRLSANQVHRKAMQDVQFKDYLIPKGWYILLIFWPVHLDPSVYPDPLKFNPWRWKDMPKPPHFTPFGGGIRLCPGMDLLKVEIAVFLHHLVLQYDWAMEDSDPPISIPFVGSCNMRVTCNKKLQ